MKIIIIFKLKNIAQQLNNLRFHYFVFHTLHILYFTLHILYFILYILYFILYILYFRFRI